MLYLLQALEVLYVTDTAPEEVHRRSLLQFLELVQRAEPGNNVLQAAWVQVEDEGPCNISRCERRYCSCSALFLRLHEEFAGSEVRFDLAS